MITEKCKIMRRGGEAECSAKTSLIIYTPGRFESNAPSLCKHCCTPSGVCNTSKGHLMFLAIYMQAHVHTPGINMVETTSASSNMLMVQRWKSLLLLVCRWLRRKGEEVRAGSGDVTEYVTIISILWNFCFNC